MADNKNAENQDKLNNPENGSEPPNSPSSSEIDGFLDDDDAIDKLLMDEMFSEPDEFASSEPEQNIENLAEIDEFADNEPDEFSESDESTATAVTENSPSLHEHSELPVSNDSYLDDFDITSDDDTPAFPEEAISDELSEQTTESGFESQTVQDALGNGYQTPNSEPATETGQETSTIETSQATDSTIIGEALTAQVSQLWAEFDDLKQQRPNSSDDVEQLNKKLKKTAQAQDESNKNTKLFASIAMGIAALASIIAIIALIQNSSLKTTISELNGLITDMEETNSGPDITTDKTLKNLKDSYLMLDNNQQGLMTQLAMLKNQLSIETTEPDQNDTAMQNSLSTLQKQVSEINNKIQGLTTSITKLEKPRSISTVKKSKKSKPDPSADWAVNLVSFKQDWYAKKKATEFKNKGIPVEVIPVKVKGEQWYRLRVTGFKTKYEAGSYASRAKKALNLSSVWVTQN